MTSVPIWWKNGLPTEQRPSDGRLRAAYDCIVHELNRPSKLLLGSTEFLQGEGEGQHRQYMYPVVQPTAKLHMAEKQRLHQKEAEIARLRKARNHYRNKANKWKTRRERSINRARAPLKEHDRLVLTQQKSAYEKLQKVMLEERRKQKKARTNTLLILASYAEQNTTLQEQLQEMTAKAQVAEAEAREMVAKAQAHMHQLRVDLKRARGEVGTLQLTLKQTQQEKAEMVENTSSDLVDMLMRLSK